MNYTRHINLTDDQDQVYCHAKGEVTPFDGPFFASNCWSCPLLCGLAGGYGVECCYQDENVGKGLEELTFRSAEDAKDHAPDSKDPKRISSPDGKKSAELRVKLAPPQKDTANKIKAEKDKKAAATAAGSEEAAATAPTETLAPVAAETAAPTEPATKSEVMAAISKALAKK